MHCYKHNCILNYIRLQIITIIIVVPIKTFDAEPIASSDALESITHNISVLITPTKPIDNELNEKIDPNLTQWSVSRPSTILKQLWSSASKSINNSFINNLKLNNFNDINTYNTKNFSLGPLKWSSEIVPSVPLGLQLSNDAIFLPHYLINNVATKTSPDGGITVINGRISSAVVYDAEQQQNLRRAKLLPKFERLQSNESPITPNISDIYLIENKGNTTEVLSTSESSITLSTITYANDSNNETNTVSTNSYSTHSVENTTDFISTSKTTTTIPTTISTTIPTTISTTISTTTPTTIPTTKITISTSSTTIKTTTNEPNITRRSFLESVIPTPLPLISNITPKQESTRRQTMKLKFGMRIPISQPPKVAIDNLLTAYKSTDIKNKLINMKLWSKRTTTKSPRISSSLSTLSQHLMPVRAALMDVSNDYSYENYPKISLITKPTQVIPIAVQNRYLPPENRNILSSMLLFPSRPTPILKPKITFSNNPINCSKNTLSENLKSLLTDQKKLRNFLNNNNSNSERRNSNEIKNFKNSIISKVFDMKKDESRIYRDKKEINHNNSDKIADRINKNDNKRQFLTELDLNKQESYPPVYSAEPEYDGIIDPLKTIPIHPTDEHLSNDKLYIPKNYVRKHVESQKYFDKYKKIPNPDLFKDDHKEEKVEPKFPIKPIDPDFFRKKKEFKDKATLPNKVMAMQELFSVLSSVKKSMEKLNPLGKKLSKSYNHFVSKVRHGIMSSSKGPYANYYPAGVYDEEYEPVEHDRMDGMSASEINETIVEPPNNYTFIDSLKGFDNNETFTENDYDDEGFIKKSFGYKVTVYRTPENGENNVTEEVINEDKNNDNKTNDLTVSESSNESIVTTDLSTGSESKPIVSLDESQPKSSRKEKHGDLKGSGKLVDYKRNKFSKDSGTHAREEKNANRFKKVDTHDSSAANERALKERTIIEFFEREHILDSAYNKDKLGIDKGKHNNKDNGNSDQYASGTNSDNTLTVQHPDESGTDVYNSSGVYSALKSDGNDQHFDETNHHITNGHNFDTTFPEHDRKYKHKNNAHKYKGWKERGYKIVTETEFVDRGQKLETGYKKHEKGNSEHIKEHDIKDTVRGDKRKYNKNIKQINKNFDSLYANQHSNSDGKDGDYHNNPNQYPIYEQPIDLDNTKQTQKQQTDGNEHSSPVQTSDIVSPQSDIHSYAPYGSRLSTYISKNSWKPIIQTSAHLRDHDLYPKTNNNNYYNTNNKNSDQFDQKLTDVKTNNEDPMPTSDLERYPYISVSPYSSQIEIKSEERPIPFYYQLSKQEYYPNLHQSTQNNSQTDDNQYPVVNDNPNHVNNDPTNYPTIETNTNTDEYTSNPPVYSSSYDMKNSGQNSVDDYNIGPQITTHYESNSEINPTKDPSAAKDPYYEYQLNPTVNSNNYNNYDQKENYRPFNFRTETMPDISAKGKNEQIFNQFNHNYPNSMIESPFANEVIHIQEAPNLSFDNYSKETQNLETITPTMTDYPTIEDIRLKSKKNQNKLTKNKPRKSRPKQKDENHNLSTDIRVIPASPLSLPPLLQNLLFNPQQFQTPYASPTMQYEIKFPFPIQTQSPTHIPLLMPTSSTPLITTNGIQLDPSDSQPIAILEPNKMITITTPQSLKRRPSLAANIWANLKPIRKFNPMSWALNSFNSGFSNKKSVEEFQTQSLPNALRFNLMTPMINNKITFKNNNRNRSLFRDLFKLSKRYDNKQ